MRSKDFSYKDNNLMPKSWKNVYWILLEESMLFMHREKPMVIFHQFILDREKNQMSISLLMI
jgi:hypothetical protein